MSLRPKKEEECLQRLGLASPKDCWVHSMKNWVKQNIPAEYFRWILLLFKSWHRIAGARLSISLASLCVNTLVLISRKKSNGHQLIFFWYHIPWRCQMILQTLPRRHRRKSLFHQISQIHLIFLLSSLIAADLKEKERNYCYVQTYVCNRKWKTWENITYFSKWENMA